MMRITRDHKAVQTRRGQIDGAIYNALLEVWDPPESRLRILLEGPSMNPLRIATKSLREGLVIRLLTFLAP